MGQPAPDGGTPSVRFARARGAGAWAVLVFAVALGGCGDSADSAAASTPLAGQTATVASRQAGPKAKPDVPAVRIAPQPARPLDAETARASVRRLRGVRAVVWRDRDHLLVMVGGQRYRSADTIDRICRSLEVLGDARAVVVDVQDINARDSEEAVAVSRGCAPAEGGRAAE